MILMFTLTYKVESMVATPAVTVVNPRPEAKVREKLIEKMNASFTSYERSLTSQTMTGQQLVESGERWKALVMNANILGDKALLQRVDSINKSVVSEAARLGYTTQNVDVLPKEIINDLNFERDRYQGGNVAKDRQNLGNIISKICASHGLSFSNIADSMEEYITSRRITALLNSSNLTANNSSSAAVATPLPRARSAVVPEQSQAQPQQSQAQLQQTQSQPQQSQAQPPQPPQTTTVVNHHNWNPLSAIGAAVLVLGIVFGGAYVGSRAQEAYDQKVAQVQVQQTQIKDAGVVGKNLAQAEGSETSTSPAQERKEATQFISAASAARSAGNIPLYNVYNAMAAQERADASSSPTSTTSTTAPPTTTPSSTTVQTTGNGVTATTPSATETKPSTTSTTASQYKSQTLIVLPGGTIFSYTDSNGIANNVVYDGIQKVNGNPEAGFQWTETKSGNLIAAGNVINVAQGDSNSTGIVLPGGTTVEITVTSLNSNNGAAAVIVIPLPSSNTQAA